MSRPVPFDRTVHGTTTDGAEIVRYERAGKWFVEPVDGGKRRGISLDEAAKLALSGQVFLGRAGGLRFDARVQQLRATTP